MVHYEQRAVTVFLVAKEKSVGLSDVQFHFPVDTTYLNVHCNLELLAERNVINFNQVEVHVFVPLLREVVVLLGFRHPQHSVEHRQPLSFGTLFRKKKKNTNCTIETAFEFLLRTFQRLCIASECNRCTWNV